MSGSQDSDRLFPIHWLAQQFFPVSTGADPQEADAIFFEFSKSDIDGSPGASRSSKRCPDVPNEFRAARVAPWSRNTERLTGNVE